MLTLPPWPHFVLLSRDSLAAVEELRDDPYVQLLQGLAWYPEQSALVVQYRFGGKNGFALPLDEGLAILRRQDGIRITAGK